MNAMVPAANAYGEEKEGDARPQHTTLAEMYTKRESIFLTGAPGTGKSWTISDLLMNRSAGKRCAFTASTALAARLPVGQIVGRTLHEWGGLYTGDKPLNTTLKLLSKRKDTYAMVKNNYQSTDTLFIDEIRMLPLGTLELANMMAQYFRRNRAPFGGIQLVLCGDFMQIPAVDEKNTISNLMQQIRYERRQIATYLKTYNIPGIYEPIIQIITGYHHFDVSKPEIQRCYIFKSPLWRSLNLRCVLLQKQFRQATDLEYQGVLHRVRNDEMTLADHKFFMSKDLTKRWNEDIKDYEADTEFNIYDHFTDATGFTIPFLHARKKFVHEYNRKMMELRVAMRGEQKEALTKYSFARLVYHHGYGRTTKVDLQQNNDISVSARKFCNARQEPDVLELMIGAPVIVLKRLGINMKNGTRARIVEIEGAKRRVQVQAEDGEVAWVTDYVQDVEIPCDGRRGQYLRISQLPLTLAFALTIHKSQGQTLSAAVVSLAETTENPGQAYVACSRVRSSDNLYVVNYQIDSFVSDPIVLDFYRQMQRSK